MGYRSDVLYVAEFEDEAKRDAAMVAAKLKYELDQSTWEEFENYGDDCIVFEVSATKWYDTYDEVAAITNMFEKLFHSELNAAVKHIRVGEDTDDMVEEHWEPTHRSSPDWFYDIYIVRTITAPWKDYYG